MGKKKTTTVFPLSQKQNSLFRNNKYPMGGGYYLQGGKPVNKAIDMESHTKDFILGHLTLKKCKNNTVPI